LQPEVENESSPEFTGVYMIEPRAIHIENTTPPRRPVAAP